MNYSNDMILKDKKICYYFKYLDWDSVFFDRPSYLLDLNKSKLMSSEVIKKEIKDKLKNSFITVKLDTKSEYKILSFLQECGFYYIDTEVTLEYVTNKKKKKLSSEVQIIKESKNKNLPYTDFEEVFTLTRFHTDLNIDNKKADELWMNYLKNYELSDSKHMFCAKVNNELAGIVLVNIDNKVASLFFVAVIDKFRDLGIGSALIDNAIRYFKGYTIRVGTQVKNINALNFYINNGLSKINKISTVLHKW
ncbi:hypothetical protein M947_08580 [Sulfurimonas hongkongensis]|uniref:N-acetyltransferase domain-containing protein n=1 Tax=Sulfurimonas hongkongensis TaxID=1172190 RepID=T0KQG8_9BACT|nr:GNAT family N-acetyltransferase [Sulfurimonas hongkongensis]EQB39199.1 hypothetical protein M947_08580 [Sulfurimonas hongkongensis]